MTTGTDLATTPRVVHPVTGEVVDVAAATPTDVLADLRDRLVEHEHDVKSSKRAIDEALTARLDYEGRRSAEIDGAAGRFKLTGKPPTETKWDGDAARVALRKLVRAGLISKDRADECVERVVTIKAKHGPLSQLLKHADERVRDAIAACRTEEPVDNRSVSVRRVVA